MSYDLYFRSGSAAAVPSTSQFQEYFGQRRHYTLQERQAWYQNDDTGVYFGFELPSDVTTAPAHSAVFNVNYGRPRIFALQAAPEIASFVHTFDLMVHDPQLDSVGDRPFDAERFIARWVSGNHVTCATLAQGGQQRPPTMAGNKLQAIWKWNSNREAVQAAAGESVFVPQILFAGTREARSAVVWTDAIPILLPEVDVVVLYRDAYAAKRLFRRRPDIVALDWSQVGGIVEAYDLEAGEVSHRRVVYEEPPPDIVRLFAQSPAGAMPELIATESLIEDEVAAQIPEWNAG